MKKKILMYMHAGSKNHGCEAIARSVCNMVEDSKIDILSYKSNEDNEYHLNEFANIIQMRNGYNNLFIRILSFIARKINKNSLLMTKYAFKEVGSLDDYALAVSIGGDNYCYDNMLHELETANRFLNNNHIKTILLGCSIETDLVGKPNISRDLNNYQAIIARESITYDALNKEFDGKGPKIYLVPDPAFTLPLQIRDLPRGFVEGNTIGINISPMIQSNETVSGITMEAYKELIHYILKETDMHVALIPHVVWDNNDDRKPIENLYNHFASEGMADRICKIDDDNAEVIKGYISRCRLFIGARTHSTIAAYSTCVPTLVVGYSVKARGIATDLFNGYKVDDLVYPVQKLSNKDDLKNAYIWLANHEDELRDHLKAVMPSYIERAYEAAKVIKEIN